MAKGGARVGAGRPPKHEPRPTAPAPRSGRDVTAMEHLQSVLNDPDASPSRKDRVAVSLLNVLIRQGGVSKKVTDEERARSIDLGTEWEKLLRRDRPTAMEPEVQAAERRKPQKPDRGIDDILAEREKALPPWRFSVPGERNDRNVPPDDE